MKPQPDRKRTAHVPSQLAAGWVRRLGSLQMAVALLPSLAGVLVLGTLIESWHGRSAAAQLVYQSWWFVLLLAFLGVNILCATLKKWPWQRHQTGFLMTHAGLLTLITGGLADSVYGTTGVMYLANSDTIGPRRADSIVDRTAERIRIRRPARRNADLCDEPFAPGPLPWSAEANFATDRTTSILGWLRSPFGHGWSRSLDDLIQFEVLTYYPHSLQEPYEPAQEDQSATSFPAFQIQLASPAVGMLPPRWVALDGANSRISLGPGRIEFLGQNLTSTQLNEFRHSPTSPSVDESVRGVLEFVTEGGRLYFRSFTSLRGSGGSSAFETAGEAEPGENNWQRIWSGMDWRFRVTTFLPRAKAGLHCTLAGRSANAVDDSGSPAVRCRLTNKSASSDFWLARTDGDWSSGSIGGERFEIGYHATRIDLGFEVTMLRAEQTVDPASGKPASLSSYVLLNDPSRGIVDEPHVVSLNQPLAHRGYRIYQGGIAPLGRDESGKPVYRVQLLANRDPGVWFKYAGSAMVALGITCMFYMRAYFFKRREPAKALP
jgi:hypothetical protein